MNSAAVTESRLIALLLASLLTVVRGLAETAPSNDFFASRAHLTGDYISVTANNAMATAESGEPDHAALGTGRSLWWTWTASSDGWVTLDSSGGAFTPCFAAYRGATLNALQAVASSSIRCPRFDWDVVPELSKSEIFRVTAGETYQIAFDSPRPLLGDGSTSPSGEFHFTLLFSSIEIIRPVAGAEFYADSDVEVQIGPHAPPEGASSLRLELDGLDIRQTSGLVSGVPHFAGLACSRSGWPNPSLATRGNRRSPGQRSL
jgi:hypothetical protein